MEPSLIYSIVRHKRVFAPDIVKISKETWREPEDVYSRKIVDIKEIHSYVELISFWDVVESAVQVGSEVLLFHTTRFNSQTYAVVHTQNKKDEILKNNPSWVLVEVHPNLLGQVWVFERI